MEHYLIDNNVISKYFSGQFSEKAMNFVAEVFDQGPNISVITEIEALSWINPEKSKEKIVQQFILDSNIYALTTLIAKRCVTIKRSRKIKTPDAIVAATALVHDFTLITCDKDFDSIKSLKIIDPLDL